MRSLLSSTEIFAAWPGAPRSLVRRRDTMIDASRSAAAKRMRRYRQRRRRGLSCVKIELRSTEVDGLIACKLLGPKEREDRRALAAALHRYLDANPIAGRR